MQSCCSWSLSAAARAFALCLLACLAAATAKESCTTDPRYGEVFSKTKNSHIAFTDLPGYTRSVYARDHALVTPESRVWAGLPGWTNALTAHIISPASGAHFSMLLVDMKADSVMPNAPAGIERFVMVINGNLTIETDGKTIELTDNYFAYFPANYTAKVTSTAGCGLLMFERIYKLQGAEFLWGDVEASPLMYFPGEVFGLRKLLPPTSSYDFNVHIMDFQPGEYLNVKEVHYNQHGLLLLEGQGIYRLGDNWYPVQAGDAIYMAPYVPQWYAALGTKASRYALYKDTILDPLLTPLA